MSVSRFDLYSTRTRRQQSLVLKHAYGSFWNEFVWDWFLTLTFAAESSPTIGACSVSPVRIVYRKSSRQNNLLVSC